MLVSFRPNMVTNKYQANNKANSNISFRQNPLQKLEEAMPDKAWLSKMLNDSDCIEQLCIRFLNPHNTIPKKVAIATLEAFKTASDGVDNLTADDAIKWIRNYKKT